MPKFNRILTIFSIAASVITISASAQAAFINWVDWTTENPESVIGLGDDEGIPIDVVYTGVHNTSITSTSGNTINYWSVGDVYTDNAVVDNRPPDSDIVSLVGGLSALTHTVTFSQAVLNPVMAILSLGRTGVDVTYEFVDEEFEILSSGRGWWGGAASGSLFQLAPNVLTGIEGHGVIQFEGSYESISWTVPTSENWHGFTFGFEGLAPDPVPLPAPLAMFALAVGGLFRYLKTSR